MKITFTKPNLSEKKLTVLGIFEGNLWGPLSTELDKKLNGALKNFVKNNDFKGKVGETLHFTFNHNKNFDHFLFIGMGNVLDCNILTCEKIGGTILKYLSHIKSETANVLVDPVNKVNVKPESMAAHIAYGSLLRSYHFDKYRKATRERLPFNVKAINVMLHNTVQASKLFSPLEKIALSVFFTRDLATEPSNVIYPKTFADEARKLTKLGVKVQVLGEKEMSKLGMNALLAVGQGSNRESQLVVFEWKGAPSQKQPVALVGKGVTFDSGGISIKPAANMEDMKWDMAGAATVLGTIRALAERKAKVNVVGIAGLVENMPSGTAQRPGDVVTSMSGQTIEVINTDAEGRLVLADALWYCQKQFNPQCIIDLATLTGAIIISLGHHYGGLFSNDDQLAADLIKAGKKENEPLWHMPLADYYDKIINCDIADMRNSSGREGGSITAAQFLQRFIKKGTAWAHLDIAGVAWTTKDLDTVPKGATGFGVRLLNRFIHDQYEIHG
ncbi:MAG: leucyl aminopeptidase [Alphaproteobacteria bacterium]|nr:leucyl aminopeptidase [Alphaproteobacteria bacterium]